VEDFSHFLELAVVMAEGESTAEGVAVAHDLPAKLGVEPSQLVERAYVDLRGALSARGSA
jgi:adenylate cyclase